MAARSRKRQFSPAEDRRHRDAVREADAYNAGYWRGQRGLTKAGRYQFHPAFARGYQDGMKDEGKE
jgi:hypothetical protein